MAHFILATVLESFVIKKNVPTKQSRDFNPLKYTKKKSPSILQAIYNDNAVYIQKKAK